MSLNRICFLEHCSFLYWASGGRNDHLSISCLIHLLLFFFCCVRRRIIILYFINWSRLFWKLSFSFATVKSSLPLMQLRRWTREDAQTGGRWMAWNPNAFNQLIFSSGWRLIDSHDETQFTISKQLKFVCVKMCTGAAGYATQTYVCYGACNQACSHHTSFRKCHPIMLKEMLWANVQNVKQSVQSWTALTCEEIYKKFN